MSAIPAQVQILIDPVLFPVIDAFDVWKRQPGNETGTEVQFLESLRGPAGNSVQFDQVSVAAGATTNLTTFAAIPGLLLETTGPGRRRVQANGVVGQTTAEMITQFTVLRKIGSGVFVDLRPAGASGFSAVRQVHPDYTHPFSVDLRDDPQTLEPVTYALAWRVHGGVSHLGKRPADATMSIPTTLSVMGVP